MTIPAVPVPSGGKVRTAVDISLKDGWSYDEAKRVFRSTSGETFIPRAELPKRARIVYKSPQHARAQFPPSEAQRDLARYMQIVLPAGALASDLVAAIRDWPPVADASLPPAISLPIRRPAPP
jgi:hypothetical protein